jgi:hypothetical protein
MLLIKDPLDDCSAGVANVWSGGTLPMFIDGDPGIFGTGELGTIGLL